MQDQEMELFEQLVAAALEGEPSKFEFIRNLEGYHYIQAAKRGIKKTVKLFKGMFESLAAQHYEAIMKDEAPVEQVILVKQMYLCYEFYKNELQITKDMLQEYRSYIIKSGHFISVFFGYQRPDQDLVDYRELSWF